MNHNSVLYEFKPDFILIFNSSHKLLEKFYSLKDEQKFNFSNDHIAQLKAFYQAISSRFSACKILYANFTEITENSFGSSEIIQS